MAMSYAVNHQITVEDAISTRMALTYAVNHQIMVWDALQKHRHSERKNNVASAKMETILETWITRLTWWQNPMRSCYQFIPWAWNDIENPSEACLNLNLAVLFVCRHPSWWILQQFCTERDNAVFSAEYQKNSWIRMDVMAKWDFVCFQFMMDFRWII